MDAEMISRWNSIVRENDDVYYLGDFSLGNWATAWSYMKKLKGRIKFIEGNHDRWFSKLPPHQKLPPIYELNFNKQLFVLSHYPLREWRKSYYGSYHCFGHTHGNLAPLGNSVDVGVDNWDFYPVCIEQILEDKKGDSYGT
jgi:calcineurin-like phosphoesterase family protein